MTIKGQKTRVEILETSFQWATQVGLTGLTIGGITERVGISKSGLFAHFKDKETLQCAVVDYAAEIFTTKVLLPLHSIPKGLARIDAFQNAWWSHWLHDTCANGHCIFGQAVVENTTLSQSVNDRVNNSLQQLIEFMSADALAAINSNELSSTTDPRQFALETYAIMTGFSRFNCISAEINLPLSAKKAWQAIVDSRKNTAV